MKTLAYILIFFGILNLFGAFVMISDGPPKVQQQGLAHILMGVGFIIGAIYTFHRIEKNIIEKKEKDKWDGKQ